MSAAAHRPPRGWQGGPRRAVAVAKTAAQPHNMRGGPRGERALASAGACVGRLCGASCGWQHYMHVGKPHKPHKPH